MILALCGYATRSLTCSMREVLLVLGGGHAALQWLAFLIGRRLLRRAAAQPESRRTAVVVGAGALGVKVARAFQATRRHAASTSSATSTTAPTTASTPTPRRSAWAACRRWPPTSRAHGVREVYITLPLGSQPRIVELLEQVQGTTASLFFVPDVFGISIIQGRLQDMNGVPVVGHLRDAVHRHQRAGQAASATSCWRRSSWC